ncbi:PREDICTED: polygalacturonase-like [Lupinus angustifolius]|uniref:polygalacturonase-like n=1 Tax=Lupinus angustifolius TaxID=3871 RepID=UPI00092EBD16|nr:PREDICTED: polygalacturonase-like [Lupinus angustifolius]
MPPQSVVLSLLIIFFSFGLCLGFYIEDKHNETNYSSKQSVNVNDYGAIANDGSDDTEAFEKTWNEACSRGATLVVPKYSVYNLKPVKFSGPCKHHTSFKVYGTIKAWHDISAYKHRGLWIMFDNVNNFVVNGGGVINGDGRKWWQNSCKVNKTLPCKQAPTSVIFSGCNNLKVKNVKFKNAPQMHLRFDKCFNVKASKLVITAPEHSPNTDGVHISGTRNMNIRNSVIGTGDDCISIVSGSHYIGATDIKCGPGHGINIGSLGAGNSEALVSNVIVNRATLTGSTNGVRIKSWQGGFGYAKNIKFLNIAMRNVTNPIIIDQNYCDRKGPCPEQDSAVKISNVVYKNITGTSASKVAIKFDCSKAVPCKGIQLKDVTLTSENNGDTTATCNNVEYSKKGKLHPQCSY